MKAIITRSADNSSSDWLEWQHEERLERQASLTGNCGRTACLARRCQVCLQPAWHSWVAWQMVLDRTEWPVLGP